MKFIKRLTIILMSLMLVSVLAACANADTTDSDTTDPNEVVITLESDTTDSNADLQADTDSNESVDSNDMEANDNSDFAGIMLTLDEVVDTVAPDGAAAGTLQVVISFQNTTDETITLPFVEDDYIITDSAGLDTVPITASSELVMPEIGAGETVTGTLEYAVVDAEGTFTFEVGDFQEITFSS